MPVAYLPSDHRDRAISAMEALRRTFERRRRAAERFAMHAASVADKDTADFFSREAKIWDEAFEEVTLRMQVEQGL